MEDHSSSNKLSSSQAISLILTLCIISGVFIYLICAKNFIFGSESGNWGYAYFTEKYPIPFWIVLLDLFLIGAVLFIGKRAIQKHEKITLLVVFLIATLIQIFLQSIYPFSMQQIITNDVANSFYSVALKYSPGEILAKFSTLAPYLPPHSRTNMPGKILFFQFLALFTKDPQTMGVMIIAVSTLGGLLLYGICKSLFQDQKTALYAFVLYALIPAKQEFLPILNSVTPVFILLSLYLFLVYLNSKKRLFLVLLGISLYGMVLFEPSPLVTGLLFVSILAHAIIHKKITLKEIIGLVLIPIFSFAATYLLVWLFFSFDLWQTFQFIWRDARNFNEIANRGYAVWLRENVKEFFYAAGLPVMMVFIYSAIDLASRWKEWIQCPSRWPMELFYTFGLILTFGVVLILGINRGEVTRLWIYLAVFFQIPAAYFLAKQINKDWLFFILAATLMIQTLFSLQRVGFIM